MPGRGCRRLRLEVGVEPEAGQRAYCCSLLRRAAFNDLETLSAGSERFDGRNARVCDEARPRESRPGGRDGCRSETYSCQPISQVETYGLTAQMRAGC